MTSQAALNVLRTCREMLVRSNTTERASPLLFRACLCTHGWVAACSPVTGSQQRMVRAGDGGDGSEGDNPLTGGPLVPLSAVLVLLCVGVVVLVYAYRQQARRRRSCPETRDSEEEEAAEVRTCRAPALPVATVPVRSSLPVSLRPHHPHHHHRTYDPPPAYLSVIAEEPPSYEMACSDDKLDRSGLTDGVS